MVRRNLFLISSSKVHGHEYLQHSREALTEFFRKHNVTKVLFIPYALFNYDKYTKKVGDVLTSWGFEVEGIHRKDDPVEAVRKADAIYVGGGNSFLLLKLLHERKLIEPIRERIFSGEAVYVGSSAGTNVATVSIKTTNDMPIVYPPTFDALALVPFNINPHYLDPLPGSTHHGETRQQRIEEFHHLNAIPVLGLREGTYLHVEDDKMTLLGDFNARLFMKSKTPVEVPPNSDMSFLLRE
ncbi:probable alpha-aspartyl dipeptidase [Lutzomyia longipalpis]|uniref:dipeptidase E n=1 Tax=Lutzomyia longipalpis TaxID=7200 RepID=A0A1B0CDZ3_LUTLO|nr:probable alpha-aspartyl dipeptidase [Lutzomyia longipalpis]XP_055685993.1 probable alpha-aspartyl dipeptidase [Lutzomyia longipalpis]